MIGKSQIQLGADQIISGMSSSDFATDGALGVASTGLNPFVQPGTMYALANGVNFSSSVSGNVIASAEDAQAPLTASLNRVFVDDSGNYYTYNGTVITLTNTATTNAGGYTAGKTDMVAFSGKMYVTTTIGGSGDIDRWDSGTLVLENSWWIATKGQSAMADNVPHPLLAYQGNLYVADKNVLNTITAAGTIAIGVLTLNSNEMIYALGIDPVTGLMMVSVQVTVNYGDNTASKYFVYLYDGISAKSTRKIPTDDLITAFYNVEGIVFVGAGQMLGQWNGNGVTFLRKFKNVGLLGTDLAYKHHFTNTRNILHVVDGPNVLSYGSVVAGKKGFFYTAFPLSGTNHLTAVIPMGNNKIAIAYATNHFVIYDLSSTGTATGTLYFNNIYFPRPIFVRRMRVITTGIVHTGSTDITANITDEKGNTLPIAAANNTISVPTGTTYVKDFDYSQAEVQAIQPIIAISNNNYGIVRVYIYYDIAQ